MEENTLEEISPSKYFEDVKSKRNTITNDDLCKIYDNCLRLANKYAITKQTKGLKKLMYHMKSIEKEMKALELGFNTFVYQDDIENYIDNIASKVVKVIELKNFEREIPDEIVELIKKSNDIFDEYYVIFTDYTGKVEKQIEKERREKDPIVFGVFRDEDTKTIIERFYYIGDWIDEYCDLTLDKLVNETKEYNGKDIENKLNYEQLLKISGLDTSIKKHTLFSKIKTVFKR